MENDFQGTYATLIVMLSVRVISGSSCSPNAFASKVMFRFGFAAGYAALGYAPP